jgi:hypothetical protein
LLLKDKTSQDILDTFRLAAPQLTPLKFLEYFPQSWIQYYFDSDPSSQHKKAVSKNRLLLNEAEHMQRKGFGVFFSVNPFSKARRKEYSMGPRAFYLDWDAAKLRDSTAREEIERRKAEMIIQLLHPSNDFPPHIVIETQHGLHVIWMIAGIEHMDADTYRQHMEGLIAQFNADENAKDITRVLRVPNFLQLKNPKNPFQVSLLYFDL